MSCSVSPNGWAQCRPFAGNSSPLCLSQSAEKKPETSGPEAESCPELHVEALETLTRASAASAEGGGVRPEQPFIVLGQEEYGEHHSSIMHCRWVGVWGQGPGRKVLTGAGAGLPGWEAWVTRLCVRRCGRQEERVVGWSPKDCGRPSRVTGGLDSCPWPGQPLCPL